MCTDWCETDASHFSSSHPQACVQLGQVGVTVRLRSILALGCLLQEAPIMNAKRHRHFFSFLLLVLFFSSLLFGFSSLSFLFLPMQNLLCCLQGYESFDKSKLENTSEEDVQTKVRLTALMTLGTRSTHELKFAEVQQALGLGSDSEVEAWVVRAIGKVCKC